MVLLRSLRHRRTQVETRDLREILDQCGALANWNRIMGADKEPRYNDFDMILTLFSSLARTDAVTTVPESMVYITLLDISC